MACPWQAVWQIQTQPLAPFRRLSEIDLARPAVVAETRPSAIGKPSYFGSCRGTQLSARYGTEVRPRQLSNAAMAVASFETAA
jgi:hypothetical protein